MGFLFLFFIQTCFADPYILCNRDAEVTAHLPDEVSSDDPCTGSVIVQGISYECAPKDEVDELRSEFFEKIKLKGQEYCQEYCKKRSTKKIKCVSDFRAPPRCGYTVPTANALKFGKTDALCSKNCRGLAFAYCSLYHASFLRTEDSLFKGKSPNCHCMIKE